MYPIEFREVRMCRTTGTDRSIYISLLGIEEVLSSFLNSSQRVTRKSCSSADETVRLSSSRSISSKLLLKKTQHEHRTKCSCISCNGVFRVLINIKLKCCTQGKDSVDHWCGSTFSLNDNTTTKLLRKTLSTRSPELAKSQL